MKQTAVFDILQLGLIRVINCCSFTSGMKCAELKTELEGGGRSHQLRRQLARKAPVPPGSSVMLPPCPRTPCHKHTLLGPACSSRGSSTPPSTPGSPQVPVLPRCQQHLGLLEGPSWKLPLIVSEHGALCKQISLETRKRGNHRKRNYKFPCCSKQLPCFLK